MRVFTAGETMVLLDGVEGGELEPGMPFRLRVGGAESNFAIALRRLGVDVAWASRLGSDPFGDFVVRTLGAEEIDLRWVTRDGAPTGVFFKWHEGGESRVLYRRAGSAASHLSPADVPDSALDGVALVHLTGITVALSATARETVLSVARRARERGCIVTFDPNYRPALWAAPRAAAEAMAAVLPHVDWYLCGRAEGELLLGASSPEQVIEAARAAGAGDAVVRVGAEGALVRQDGQPVLVPPLRVEEVVDEIGAGDGFAAGFAYSLLQGREPARCARAGNQVAAAALRGTGDWETYPRLGELDLV